MLTLLTTTGARQEAFALCERMMFGQDHGGPVTWIVVDDGETPQPLSPCRDGWRRIVIRPEPFWRPGDNTQARNLAAGLDAAEELAADAGAPLRLAVIEDDDWYDPRWLSTVAKKLDRAELIGESHARYYNAAMRRGSYLNNAFHASLRSSALRGRAIPALRRALAEFSTCYDFKLWCDPAPAKHLFETGLTVGIKGLPGRPGIAAGHREMAGYPDPDLTLLRQWIGEDADLYARFYREDAMTQDRTQMYATSRIKKYENRQLVAGDGFMAKDKDVKVLRALKFATEEPPVAAPALPAASQPAPASAEASPAPEPEIAAAEDQTDPGAPGEEGDAPTQADEQDDETGGAAPDEGDAKTAESGKKEKAPAKPRKAKAAAPTTLV